MIFELWPYCDNTEMKNVHLSLYNLANNNLQFSVFIPIVYNVLEKCQTPVFDLVHLLLHSSLQFERVLTRRGHGCDAFVKAQRFSVTSVIGGNDPHPVRGHCP